MSSRLMIWIPVSAGNVVGGSASGLLAAIWHVCVPIIDAAPARIRTTKSPS